jgi:alkanesulfonate monooxygenase SsuD/methylene tetrahydromethanopterin reductase-like flavin-dependent oxidoreductase (luciferase family)
MAGFIAARTSRVRVGTAVVNLCYTHPLRFAERVAMLDHLTGGRLEVGVGRGYQFPQYGVFGVPIDHTREILDEALDVIALAWRPEEFSYRGKWFTLPSARIWPVPVRRPEEVLLHAIGSAESMESSIRRGIPGLFARPLDPFRAQVVEFARYREALLRAGRDPDAVLQRATVLKYAFVGETKAEAHALAREAMEWDLEILQRLTTPTTAQMPKGYDLYERRGGQLPEFVYDDWKENVLLFDDPDGCAAKLQLLADAGVRSVLLWMGVGGVAHEHVVRSMRLFAQEVAPRFRS